MTTLEWINRIADQVRWNDGVRDTQPYWREALRLCNRVLRRPHHVATVDLVAHLIAEIERLRKEKASLSAQLQMEPSVIAEIERLRRKERERVNPDEGVSFH